jgi:hypothetical protein
MSALRGWVAAVLPAPTDAGRGADASGSCVSAVEDALNSVSLKITSSPT